MEQTKYLWGVAVLLIAVAVSGYFLMSSKRDKTDDDYSSYNQKEKPEIVENKENDDPKNDDSGQATFLTPDKKAISFDINGGEETIIIGADGKWYVAESPDWVKTKTDKGELVINTTYNETSSVRYGYIKLSGKSNVTATIKVTQASNCTQKYDDGDKVTVTVNGVSYKLVRVTGDTFTMGATAEQYNYADRDESPTHQVTLSSYYIGQTEVTQELWQAVMGNNPSYYKGAKRPVEMVSWYNCQEFLRKLNQLTGKNFRLPTEAEWEYAARGGSKRLGYKYSGNNKLSMVSWYHDNSGECTHDVATKQPNELGLYDMSGNVWEWCRDWYGSYSSSAQTNPVGPSSGSYRVIRGGSWYTSVSHSRVAYRWRNLADKRNDDLGLRLAL